MESIPAVDLIVIKAYEAYPKLSDLYMACGTLSFHSILSMQSLQNINDIDLR